MAVENWVTVQQMVPKHWTCGHCGLNVGGNRGYYRNDGGQLPGFPPHVQGNQPGSVLPPNIVGDGLARILICPTCDRPTYFEKDRQVPGIAYGSTISHLPPDVDALYTEARNCMAVSAFTASVLATRKLLMNVAVSQGAEQNKQFYVYVNYLADKGYVPPNAKSWVDHIREKGNEATHEIPAIKEDDAKDMLTFMEMILKLVFEYPQRVPKPGAPPASGS
jgi:Domain of unknown function (DUF4145)